MPNVCLLANLLDEKADIWQQLEDPGIAVGAIHLELVHRGPSLFDQAWSRRCWTHSHMDFLRLNLLSGWIIQSPPVPPFWFGH